MNSALPSSLPFWTALLEFSSPLGPMHARSLKKWQNLYQKKLHKMLVLHKSLWAFAFISVFLFLSIPLC